MIINAIKDYMNTCPYIKEMGNIKVDFLSDSGDSFSIEPVSVNPIVEDWIYGGGVRQYQFTFAVRFNYSAEAKMNIENSGFMESIEKWIKEQDKNGNLPDLDEGQEATKLEVISNGYLFGVSQDWKYGRYQMSMRLEYDEYE